MKKYALLFLTALVPLFAAAQESKYFDVDHKEISKSTFQKKRAANAVLDFQNDSTHHLINREEKGTVKDKVKLVSLLEIASKQKIDPSKPIVIIYYPGKDPCNSSGNIKFVAAKDKELEKDLSKKYKIQPLFIYKENTGLDRFKKAINWVKDPGQAVEKHFFKHHYPCGSFVVISKNGDYISYFGEYMNSQVLEATKKLSEQLSKDIEL